VKGRQFAKPEPILYSGPPFLGNPSAAAMRSTPSELARSALDAAPDAMIIIDRQGAIRFANRQLSALFGYEHDEVIGKPIELLMPDRFRARHVAHRDEYVKTLTVRAMGSGLDLYARRRDGTEFPVEISLSPIRDGDQELVAAAIRDTTDRIRAQVELIAAREAAERAREIADQAREVAVEAREVADRANQGKSRFLATASHDLRQPLQTLALLNGSLRRLVGEPDALEAIAQQELAIGAMSRLLNALLDISKLESGAIKPEPTDFKVAELFDELRNEFAGVAAKKGLHLDVEPSGDCVHSDPSLVEQILRNLLSNAIKYTREGRVRLRCLHEQSRLVRIEVVDTGVGIPPDQLPFICDEFYQVGVPTNSTRDGYGLGLSIVQRLVALLNAGFDVKSEVGKGSAFSLVLPASFTQVLTPEARRPEQMESTNTAGKRHVLLVEDDQGVRDATRMLLKVEGYRVTAVATLAQAVATAKEDAAVDLLLTDYHLGSGETGTQVITELRQILQRAVSAVLMTGDTSTAMREVPLDLDVRVASKPIKAEELLGLLKELLH
jgi:two-component system, sensor histidine kinase